MANIHIVSDFEDFYDTVSKTDSNITYTRNRGDCMQRGTALKYLRMTGLKTIDVQPVNQFLVSDGKLVVYTNPKLHNGKGKRIMTANEAMTSYSNYIASKYYENTLDFIKFIQIGKRRFTITCKRDNEQELSGYKVVDISEMSSDYNRIIALPIFSIDYICINNEMIATDFNEVEMLKSHGISKFMTPEQVAEEIQSSLIVYNKA